MQFLTAVFLCFLVILAISWILREIKCIHYTFLCSLNGPKGYPVIGSIISLLQNWKAPMRQYSKWAVEFGGIYKVKIGSQLAVVVSDSEHFTKIFAKTGNKLNYRVRGNVLSAAMGNKGIATSDGKVWLDHRRFSTKAFRDLNIGRSSTDQIIFSEVSRLTDRIKSRCTQNDSYDDAETDVSTSVFSILWRFVSSSDEISLDDLNIRKMLKGTRAQMKAAEQSGGWNYYFVLQVLWIISANPLKLLPSYIRRILFVKKELNHHREFYGNPEKENFPSLVQLYLNEIFNSQEATSELSEKQLEVFASDFIVAGVESLASSIRWTLMYLVAYPDCMQKLRNELDDRLRDSSLPEVASYATRQDLPYLEAVIAESLRIRPAIHTIVHVTQEDIILAEDHFVPRETWIIGNIWGIHHNPKVWDNPESFQPERFLDSNGQIIREKIDKCFSFSTGPRRCLGEQLSRMEIHAFIAAFVTQFDISFNPKKLHSFTFEPEVTLSLIPKDEFLIFKIRNKSIK